MNIGRSPTLRYLAGSTEATHASWLELFFDLVFVAAVSELARLLHEDLTLHGLLVFCALFVPVWWVWMSFAYYADLFETEATPFRIALLAGMFGSLVLASTIGVAMAPAEGGAGGAHGFALANAVLQAILAGLYGYARRAGSGSAARNPALHRLCGIYVAGFGCGGALWLLSVAVPAPWHLALWALALVVEIATPFMAYLSVASPPAHASHLPERLGLFTLIVLGESVIAVAWGARGTTSTPTALPVAFFAFVIAACLWWVYFEHVDHRVIINALTSGRSSLVRGFAYGYGHLPIFAGLAATAVGSEVLIEHAGADHLPANAGLALTGGAAVFLLATTAAHLVIRRPLARRLVAIRVTAAVSAVSLGLASTAFSPLAETASVAGLLTLLTWAEIRHRPREA
ncbi:low temperature requirement protein A [Sphaerisporangium perillae]|uniref:low temperature requirement protein A n=1 Tax=Sphaerisporangium perillae TaxID=2935860 RepID=UPI00200E0E33|nr:low temperature requirement protein A [Sphaerisporangium perillae]